MLRHPINFATLTISIFIIGLLTIISFFGAWAYDDGSINISILASLFKVFRFPTHTLFSDVFNQTTASFYSGLLLNVFFFAFLTERIFSFLKNKKETLKFFISALFIVALYSCQTKQKFDRTKWVEVADLTTFPNRKYMIDDLVQNYQLKGKTFHELVELLGQPQSKLDSTLQVFYDIDIDFGSDIDPVYTKTLSIAFDKDTTVKNIEVQEWKK